MDPNASRIWVSTVGSTLRGLVDFKTSGKRPRAETSVNFGIRSSTCPVADGGLVHFISVLSFGKSIS